MNDSRNPQVSLPPIYKGVDAAAAEIFAYYRRNAQRDMAATVLAQVVSNLLTGGVYLANGYFDKSPLNGGVLGSLDVLAGRTSSGLYTMVNPAENGSSGHVLTAGQVVNCTVQYANVGGTQNGIQLFVAGGAGIPFGTMIACNLAYNSGPDGMAPSTGAQYTYDAHDLYGALLGTALVVQKARVLKCHTIKATHGIGYMNISGTFVLWDTDEDFGGDLCT